MHDIQSGADLRGIPIDQVGVTDLSYPISVLDRAHEKQQTVAKISMSVSLPHNFKGTHMSRFIEVLNEHRGEITMRTLPKVLDALKERLDAESARVEVLFPYFMERVAPASSARALMDYACTFTADAGRASVDFTLGVKVPVTSVCPCSKAISDYGAHNQRGIISIEVRTATTGSESPAIVWIEDLVEVAEQSASAPVYPLLKRSDERFVTMQAYDNPVFVEDIVRNVATRLKTDPRIGWFHVEAVNHESIHNHAAFAQVTWARPLCTEKTVFTESAQVAAH